MYYSQFYFDLTENEIKMSVSMEGFEPIFISNTPGYVYPKHSHPETKLLAFLSGEMIVEVNGKAYSCTKGDKIIIPGNTVHSAKVGGSGCTFFWAESLL